MATRQQDCFIILASLRDKTARQVLQRHNCKQPGTSTSVTKWFALGFMRQTRIPGDQQSDLALHKPTTLLVSLRSSVIWHWQGRSDPGCSLQINHGPPCPSHFTLSLNDERSLESSRSALPCCYCEWAQWLWRGISRGVRWFWNGPQTIPASHPRERDWHWLQNELVSKLVSPLSLVNHKGLH